MCLEMSKEEIFWLIFSHVLSIIGLIGINTFFKLKSIKNRIRNELTVLQVFVFIWIITSIYRNIIIDENIEWIITLIHYFSVCFIGAVFFNFIYYYTQGKINEIIMWIVYGFSLFNFLILVTNSFHHLFYIEYTYGNHIRGPFFYVHTSYSYTLLVLSYILLIEYLLRSKGKVGNLELIIFCIAMIIPISVNVLFVFKIMEMPFDVSPLLFNISLQVIGYWAYKYSIFDVKSIARYSIYENIHEGIMVFDHNLKLEMANPAIYLTLKGIYIMEDHISISQILSDLKPIIDNYKETYRHIMNFTYGKEFDNQLELKLKVGEDYREFRINFLRMNIGKKNEKFLLGLYETTKYNKAVDQLAMKGELLEEANRKLSEEVSVKQRLAITKERNRVSKEIHDILSHSLTLVISIMETIRIGYKKDRRFAIERVKKAKEITRSSLYELKKTLLEERTLNVLGDKLLDDITTLGREVEEFGVNVEVVLKGTEYEIEPQLYDTIFRICQESITNAIRHGQPTSIVVAIRIDEKSCNLIIMDNGSGCEKFNKGNGIRGMENRVIELNGSFNCGALDDKGFSIQVNIPLNNH